MCIHSILWIYLLIAQKENKKNNFSLENNPLKLPINRR